jgi:superfamily II DNA or RNA helicase/5-methylcytosine-specific restriction endonuclease McrA
MGVINEWDRKYDLNEARKHPSKRTEATHQTQALAKLRAWYESEPTSGAGGLLVLPTGAGKTFTAIRFLCRNPLSDGYKVLWLAHTHHLLEQALDGFGKRSHAADEMEVGLIHEPKEYLRAKVVSGTIGHGRIADVSADDDVVICTLQTAVRAFRENHASLRAFLDAAKGKLMVVFDEAHHSPAPSYAEFILALRQESPKMKLLGLTATPMYSDEKRSGWLTKLFPQRIISEVSASRLIAAEILARPIPIPCTTKFKPKFDTVQYQRWRASYQDVPEDIITQLAQNQTRNDVIWKTYVDRRKEFGKTIVFADRWIQCDYLREKLIANGVRADVVYSHIDADPGSVDGRNRRSRDENAIVLNKFRNNELDVLINVRMLTEGTDVPMVQSVFLTRQTTSQILMRQMVGRALRGPKFGGTETANIVLFMDDWREAIQWADFDELWGKETGGEKPKPRKRLPLGHVSIGLIRELARQMESGEIATADFLEMLPIGWYVPEFDAEITGSDDSEHISPMVLVFQDEKLHYEAFISGISKGSLSQFADPGVKFESAEVQIGKWIEEYFSDKGLRGSGIGMNLFHLVRHLAQAGGQPPPFFPFEQRNDHNLSPMAQIAAQEDWGDNRRWDELQGIYHDERKFWRALYPTFDQFRDQFRLLVEGENQRRRGRGRIVPTGHDIIEQNKELRDQEPPEAVKREVIRRDGKCLCCGNTQRLQVDHIKSRYGGGAHDPSNLQTLCSICNRDKNIKELHFRILATDLTSAPPFRFPVGFTSNDLDDLSCDIQRTINMFYECAAVDEIEIKRKGTKRREWRIRLRSKNPRSWFEEPLRELFERVREAQAGDPYGCVRSIILETAGDGVDGRQESFRVFSDQVGTKKPMPLAMIRPRASVTIYCPSIIDLPNELIRAKVIRVDANKRLVDVRATIGRQEREIFGLPVKAIFSPDLLDRTDESQD